MPLAVADVFAHRALDMALELAPPGREGRLDRVGRWMRARKWRQWLVLCPLAMVLMVTLFAAWIGLAYLLGSTDRDAGAVALNFVVVGFVATAVLLVMHPAMYRWFWHLERKRRIGRLRPDDPIPAFGSEPTAPPPDIDWPWSLRLRHWLVRLCGIAALLYIFLPYRNQRAIARFLTAHSAGSASAGSLATLIFIYLPLCVTMGLAVLLTYRQMRRNDAGLLDERQQMLLDAEIMWLLSFGSSFVVALMLCRLGGGMIVEHL